jgi:hypothetical protein
MAYVTLGSGLPAGTISACAFDQRTIKGSKLDMMPAASLFDRTESFNDAKSHAILCQVALRYGQVFTWSTLISRRFRSVSRSQSFNR